MKKIAVWLFIAIIFFGGRCLGQSGEDQTENPSPENKRIIELFTQQLIESYAREHPQTYLQAHDAINVLVKSNNPLYKSLMKKYGSDKVFDGKPTRHVGYLLPFCFIINENNHIISAVLSDTEWELVLSQKLNAVFGEMPFDAELLFFKACFKKLIKTELYRTIEAEIINIVTTMGPLADLYFSSKSELFCIQENPPLYFSICELPLCLGESEVEKWVIEVAQKGESLHLYRDPNLV